MSISDRMTILRLIGYIVAGNVDDCIVVIDEETNCCSLLDEENNSISLDFDLIPSAKPECFVAFWGNKAVVHNKYDNRVDIAEVKFIDFGCDAGVILFEYDGGVYGCPFNSGLPDTSMGIFDIERSVFEALLIGVDTVSGIGADLVRHYVYDDAQDGVVILAPSAEGAEACRNICFAYSLPVRDGIYAYRYDEQASRHWQRVRGIEQFLVPVEDKELLCHMLGIEWYDADDADDVL